MQRKNENKFQSENREIELYIYKISAAQINPLTRVDADTKGFCLQVYTQTHEQTADAITARSHRIYRCLFMYSTIRGTDINDNARDGGLNDEAINIDIRQFCAAFSHENCDNDKLS